MLHGLPTIGKKHIKIKKVRKIPLNLTVFCTSRESEKKT